MESPEIGLGSNTLEFADNVECLVSIFAYNLSLHYRVDIVKPVCNDHLYDKIYYLWFIQ